MSAPTTTPGSPLARADEVTVKNNAPGPVSVDVLANDEGGNSPLDRGSLFTVTNPLHAEDFAAHHGNMHYKSVRNFSGIDIIKYQICNTNGLCDVGTITITVVN